ncbi:cytochrome c-type biogenesis protein CcmH [Rhizomicrobium palustre]|uniref:Cytochrome c-type biogenesis protein n=1 Tax=Rhizomicrobium palustre TaxID=189966 RepID=A0A846MW07_9PROT|nr:cytochrome c-type biogenesis protein [Rhizomicrobium palustre]NIK87409.1 cytochrome c-type biogenesis protein CcmH [Rhizomicrobium palustre]
MTKPFAKFFTGTLLAASLFASTAYAIRPEELLADPKLEARARAISKELRCVVCQNESIDDSNADIAHDLRVIVRQRIMAGDTDEQVKAYLVARYGNYVLLKPPFDPETYLLWFGPFFLLLCAGGIAVLYIRGVNKSVPAAPLSTDEAQRLAALLDDGKRKED